MRLIIDAFYYSVLILAHFGWRITISGNRYWYAVWCTCNTGWGLGYYIGDDYFSLQIYLLGMTRAAIEIGWTYKRKIQKPRCQP